MNETASVTRHVPVRVDTSDDPADILRFAVEAFRDGGAALATLVEIRGGAARALGSHVAVASDGRFCGYVSGGCVEAAVAAEAMQAMAERRDRIVSFGEGSPFFDIVLPCGGGISIAIHVLRSDGELLDVLDDLAARRAAALAYRERTGELVRWSKVLPRSQWREDCFVCVYRPVTRVAISGNNAESQAVSRLALAAGFEVRTLSASTPSGRDTSGDIDPYTAVVLLHHDLDREMDVLSNALVSPAFYIGALGSTRTHRRRIERLRAMDIPSESFDRIRAPIGLFGPTRDATSLALSVLADIAAVRLEAFG